MFAAIRWLLLESSRRKFNRVQETEANEPSEASEGQNYILDPTSLVLQQVVHILLVRIFLRKEKRGFLLWSHN